MRLEQLVKQGSRFGAEYKGAMANHLPMALFALKQLGATDPRLAEFYQFYVERLEKKKSATETIDDDNWLDFLGSHRCNAEYLRFFLGNIRERGVDETLRLYLGRLWPGVGGGAFHPLIRVAYGLDAENPEEIAEGLAAWAMAYLRMGDGPPSPHTGTPPELVKRLSEDEHFLSLKPSGPYIFSRMKIVSEDPQFADFRGALIVSGQSLSQIATTVLDVYHRSGGNFTALHLVTATHAARLVLPYIQQKSDALRDFWDAIMAAVVTLRLAAAPLPTVPDELPPWETIANTAVASSDDHVIKLVYTCRQEHAHYQNRRYHAVAAQKVKLA